MRLLNILVIAALILAASFVYKIKFDSTLQAERVGKVAAELRRERTDLTALDSGDLALLQGALGVPLRHLLVVARDLGHEGGLVGLDCRARGIDAEPGGWHLAAERIAETAPKEHVSPLKVA